MKLKTGDLAPLFKMEDSDGQLIDLSALKGSKVVLYFYPKDDTPGCTAQACNLNENLSFLQANGFVVIGVSADSNKAHEKFKLKYNLKFSLLSESRRLRLASWAGSAGCSAGGCLLIRLTLGLLLSLTSLIAPLDSYIFTELMLLECFSCSFSTDFCSRLGARITILLSVCSSAVASCLQSSSASSSA